MKSLASTVRKVPRAAVRRMASALVRISVVSDAACPTFSPISEARLAEDGYFSQIGQDLVVDKIFFGKMTGGTFVDIGAHDGISLSNTYFLESVRKWNGLCVEANPEVVPRLRENRRCIVEQVAVGPDHGTVNFTAVDGPEMLSGVSERLNRRHRRRIKDEIKRSGGRQEVIRVPVRPLQALLDEHNIVSVDFLSIDTEGSELDVLKGLDFEKTRVAVICIERNYESGQIPGFLRDRGFVRVFALSHDDFYLRRDLAL